MYFGIPKFSFFAIFVLVQLKSRNWISEFVQYGSLVGRQKTVRENSLSIENCGCFSWQSVDCHKNKTYKKKNKFVEFSQIRLRELARDLVGIFLELIKTISARPLITVRTVLDCNYVKYYIILDLFYYRYRCQMRDTLSLHAGRAYCTTFWDIALKSN